MSNVINYSFQQFVEAVKSKLSKDCQAIDEKQNSALKSIFDHAAKYDEGQDDSVFESNEEGFNKLVGKGTLILNAFENVGQMFAILKEKIVSKSLTQEVLPEQNESESA